MLALTSMRLHYGQAELVAITTLSNDSIIFLSLVWYRLHLIIEGEQF